MTPIEDVHLFQIIDHNDHKSQVGVPTSKHTIYYIIPPNWDVTSHQKRPRPFFWKIFLTQQQWWSRPAHCPKQPTMYPHLLRQRPFHGGWTFTGPLRGESLVMWLVGGLQFACDSYYKGVIKKKYKERIKRTIYSLKTSIYIYNGPVWLLRGCVIYLPTSLFILYTVYAIEYYVYAQRSPFSIPCCTLKHEMKTGRPCHYNLLRRDQVTNRGANCEVMKRWNPLVSGNHQLSHEKKKRPYFPLNPGRLIAILIIVYILKSLH